MAEYYRAGDCEKEYVRKLYIAERKSQHVCVCKQNRLRIVDEVENAAAFRLSFTIGKMFRFR